MHIQVVVGTYNVTDALTIRRSTPHAPAGRLLLLPHHDVAGLRFPRSCTFLRPWQRVRIDIDRAVAPRT